MAVRLFSRHKYRAQRSLTLIVQPPPEILAARDDLGAFGELVAGKIPADVHRTWFPFLVPEQDSECLHRIAGPNVNLLSFRGSAKTTWARIWLAWAIGHNPGIQCGWIAFTEKISIKSSRYIKRLIESPTYQQIFPWIKPGQYWSDLIWAVDWSAAGVSEFDVDFTFAALGITGGITSNRFHLAVYDDLIKSAKAIKNPEIRAEMVETYGEVIEPCIEAVPGARQVSLGTRFRGDDIHCTEFTPANGWQVIEQGAIVRDPATGAERSAWPERIPLEKLLRLRRRRPVIFSYQWMNSVPALNPEDMPISPDDIQYTDQIPPRFPELILGVDLAASEEKKNDATALILAGRVGDRIVLLDREEYRISGNLSKIQKIMKLWKKWNRYAPQLRIVFGKPAYQKSFEGDWQDYKRRYSVRSVTCEGLPENLDKDEKLEAISGVFEDRLVWFWSGRDWGGVVAQLLRTDLEADDYADAAYFCLSKLQRRARRPLSSA